MTSKLPGDLEPAEPGLEQLVRTLTSGGTAEELAGERTALAMFRANIHQTDQTRPLRTRIRARGHRRFRLVAVSSVAALVGGFAAAAYAEVLPAPLQHAAYQALHSIGVPDTKHGSNGVGHEKRASGSPHGRTPASSHPAAGSPGQSPASSSSRSPSAASGGAGAATVSATTAAGQIAAGSSATIQGRLAKAGQPVSGVRVRLWAHTAGRRWRFAGQATTTVAGTVKFTVPDLAANTQFRLTDPDGPASSALTVTVVPQVTTSLRVGSGGFRDYLSVSTKYAHLGDAVELQAYINGSWVELRKHLLGAAGKTEFVLSTQQLSGDQVRAVLLASRRHATAASSPMNVPASS